jgi:hypothetical protein
MNRINILGFKRLTPKNAGQEVFGWGKQTQVEKLIWLWNYTNRKFYAVADKNYSNVSLVKYEDVFVEKDVEKIRELLDFIDPPGDSSGLRAEEFVRLLQTHINSSYSEFRENTGWWEPGGEETSFIREKCGDLMKKFGYP